ncbi:ATP-binding protein [Polaribacter batillariae]|uniref:ATP-binding protein n=1 Tax=Polaribacter batillariae TaxID=2808900 RepID=A0ABX7SZE5_9FLAO|nr:ATP-binding protein [Polaribacter batillariae]QTD38386.1 ATP-binding protein [Polaribacter batillariae]
MQQKIVLIGGPSTGKTTVLNNLISRDFFCMEEVSREVILKAKEKGIDQLFLTEPLLFSTMLLEGREQQYKIANKTNHKLVFFDRGLPDIYAYMNYFKTSYPAVFLEKSKQYKYDAIFHFSPWKQIHTTDNERYETFEQAVTIDQFLVDAYKKLGYTITNVPFGKVEERTNFILNSLSCDL